MTTIDFIEKAKIVHGDIYDYSKFEYFNCYKRGIIICKKHGEFIQIPRSHLKGDGCAKCSYVNLSKKNTSTAEEFIEKAIKIHGDNYKYSNLTYVNYTTPVNILCKTHGIFKLRPYYHLNGNGCPNCKYVNKTEEFIEKATKKYGDTYEYTDVDYVNSKTHVNILCKIHGMFQQLPNGHLRGGCNKCSIVTKSKKLSFTKDEFIERAIKIHGNTFNYSKVEYINTNSKVTITCKEHGDFEQRPHDHISKIKKQGCPFCQSKKSYSKAQIKWLTFLNPSIQHAENGGEYCIPETKYRADGYCKEPNTIYEFHGDYWHGNPKVFDKDKMNMVSKKTFGELYQRTLEKEEMIKELGYNLVVMWERDWINLNRSVRKLQRLFRKYNVKSN